LPDRFEPTPETSQDRASQDRVLQDRADAGLTTASLAKAARDGAQVETTRTFASPESQPGETAAPLFAGEETVRMRTEWDAIQASFVDEPRQAVEAADRLVATSIRRLAEVFAEEKARLEGQWDRGGDVSTEDLRQALRRYRSFFGRVLSV
jgi:hypothetical protein